MSVYNSVLVAFPVIVKTDCETDGLSAALLLSLLCFLSNISPRISLHQPSPVVGDVSCFTRPAQHLVAASPHFLPFNKTKLCVIKSNNPWISQEIW